MLDNIGASEVIELAREFHVEKSSVLENFICELLQVDVSELYDLLDGKGE